MQNKTYENVGLSFIYVLTLSSTLLSFWLSFLFRQKMWGHQDMSLLLMLRCEDVFPAHWLQPSCCRGGATKGALPLQQKTFSPPIFWLKICIITDKDGKFINNSFFKYCKKHIFLIKSHFLLVFKNFHTFFLLFCHCLTLLIECQLCCFNVYNSYKNKTVGNMYLYL